MVEAALVLPVIILLVMGILEFGLLFTSYSTTGASTRSGARIAATRYATATPANRLVEANTIALATAADLTVLNNADPVGMVIYKVNSASSDGAPFGGFPGDGMSGGCTSSCIRYSWNPGTQAMVRTGGSWTDPDGCGLTVDSIGVFVQTQHDFITGMFGSQRYVNGHTVMRIEPLPTDQCSGESPT